MNHPILRAEPTDSRRHIWITALIEVIKLIILYLAIIMGIACNVGPSTPPDQHVEFYGSSLNTTEIRFRVNNHSYDNTSLFVIRRSSQSDSIKIVLQTILRPFDTLFIDRSLKPKTTYHYIAYQSTPGFHDLEIGRITHTTLDSSNHFVRWFVDTLGDGASSLLNDVFIINDSCMYAVGEIALKDSQGIYQADYGFARWDGTNWNLFRLAALNPLGYYSNLVPTGFYAFGPKDIWFVSGGVFHWNGDTLTSYWINYFSGNPQALLTPGESIKKLWGTSSTNLYVVGDGGAIVHFDGSNWKKIESRTVSNINDIWGSITQDRKSSIYCTVSNRFYSGDIELLSINSNTYSTITEWFPTYKLLTVWFRSSSLLFIGGEGVFVGDPMDPTKVNDLPLFRTTRIRGIDNNDVFAVGVSGTISHYNGISWDQYPEVQLLGGSLETLSVQNNLVLAAGYINDRAIIIRGYR